MICKWVVSIYLFLRVGRLISAQPEEKVFADLLSMVHMLPYLLRK